MHPEILLINLDRSVDRLQFQRRQLGRLGLHFVRLRGCTPQDIDDRRYRELAWRWQRPMSRTEVACLLSHARAWRHVADSGRPALVLEDDAVVSDGLPGFLAQLGRRDLAREIVNLETRHTRKFVSRRTVADEVAGVRLFELMIDRGGAAAYVVGPQAAERLLERMSTRPALADALINATRGVRRLQAEPALAVPSDCLRQRPSGAAEPPPLPSTIESARERRGFLGYQVRQWLTAPRCRLRRLAGVLTLTVRKTRLRRRAAVRPIASCATIEHNWLNQRPAAGATPPSESP